MQYYNSLEVDNERLEELPPEDLRRGRGVARGMGGELGGVVSTVCECFISISSGIANSKNITTQNKTKQNKINLKEKGVPSNRRKTG